jgi:hypothetical protein
MFPEQPVMAAHGFMTHSGRRSRFLLYAKTRPCKLFSRLPEIFEGKSRGDIQGIPRGPGGKRTPPAGAEKVMEFSMKKVVS